MVLTSQGALQLKAVLLNGSQLVLISDYKVLVFRCQLFGVEGCEREESW